MGGSSKEYRHWLKENHRCTSCKKQDAFTLAGRWLCSDCNDKHNKYNPKERTEKQRKYDRDRYDWKKANGICVKCNRPAQDGKTLCKFCSAKENLRGRKAYNKKSGGMTLSEMGLCHWCRTPTDGAWYCPDCKAKVVKNLKPYWNRSNRREENLFEKSMKSFWAPVYSAK